MSVPSATWIQTVKGGIYDYAEHSKSTPITPHVISHSLSRTWRFRGHSAHRWTVAEHSMLVRDIGVQLTTDPVEKIQAAPYLLLHDAHEAFLGDIPAPLKKYLKHTYAFDLKGLENEADRRIYKDLKLPSPPAWVKELIAECDIVALKLEREAFMASKHEWVIDEIPLPAGLVVPPFQELTTNKLTRFFRVQIEEAIHAATAA